jgi:hypothetical protein
MLGWRRTKRSPKCKSRNHYQAVTEGFEWLKKIAGTEHKLLVSKEDGTNHETLQFVHPTEE